MTATATNGTATPAEVPAMHGAVDLSRYVPEDVEPQDLGAEPVGEDLEPTSEYADAVKLFRRPFGWNAVKFRALVSLDVGKPGGTALIAAYIDARLVIERLNLVVAGQWQEEYRPTNANVMWCDLTVLGVKHTDVGEDYTSAKALVSDALKRAAVKHGIGVSLYAVPKMWLAAGRFLTPKKGKGDPYFELSADGEQYARQVYAAWLQQEGERAFGEVLSHGDGIGSVGEALDGIPVAGQPAPSAGPSAAPAALDPIYDQCFTAARQWVGDDLGDIADDDVEGTAAKKAQESRIAQLRLRLVLAGAEKDITSTRDAINGLTVEQATGLLAELRKLNEKGSDA